MVGPTRDGSDGRRRGRHPDRGAGRPRRRGRAVRTPEAHHRPGDPRQLRARPRRRGSPRRPPPRRRARPAGPLHQPGASGHRRRGPGRPRSAPSGRRRRVVQPARRGAARRPRAGRRGGGGGPLPLPRRPPAGHRARRGPDQDVVGRGDHSSPRRPLPRPERPDEPPTGTAPGAEGDHPLELRAVVPRRPAGTVGPGHLRGRRATRGGRVRARGPRRPRRRGDGRRGSVGQPFARHRRRRRGVTVGPLPALGQHPGLRPRGHGRGGDGRASRCRPRRLVRGRRRVLDRRRAQPAPGRAPRLRPNRAGQHRRRPVLERRPGTRSSASTW